MEPEPELHTGSSSDQKVPAPQHCGVQVQVSIYSTCGLDGAVVACSSSPRSVFHSMTPGPTPTPTPYPDPVLCSAASVGAVKSCCYY